MALLPLFFVVLLAATVAGLLVLGRGTSRSSEAAVVAARRHALAVSVLAPIAGLVAAVLLVLAGGDGHHGFPGSTGDALSLAPGAWALTHTLVHLAGELTWPRPEGRVRRARLVRRRMRDVAPRMLVRLGAGGLALLAVELLLGIALAGPDGARVSHGTPGPPRAGSQSWTAGPWPGWHYAGPVLIELVLLVAVGAVALRVVVDRPAVATEDPRVETALRRASAHRVLRGIVGPVLVLAGGFLAVEAGALGSVHLLPLLAGNLLALVGDGVALAGLVVLCLPAPRIPDRRPAAAVG